MIPLNTAELPHAASSLRVVDDADIGGFYDVKFAPQEDLRTAPTFAVVGGSDVILICRIMQGAAQNFEILHYIREIDSVGNNSCVWVTRAGGDPLLGFGGKGATIKLLDVRTGEIVRVLAGHGGEINDLAISPADVAILASASEDHSIRLWSLDRRHLHQPCAAIFAGEGHKAAILTLAFHASGRYLLSGGMDRVVNLWVIPELPDDALGTEKPAVIYYPHFFTRAIHSQYVDCVTFHGDLILSKCPREGHIVLWRIEGFSSAVDPPKQVDAPTAYQDPDTRSAFGSGYQRILHFQIPQADQWYMRFDLFSSPAERPVLAMGDEAGTVLFWDLKRLEEPGALLVRPTDPLVRTDHIPGDPETVAAHKRVACPSFRYCARQASWSAGGQWLVVVGDDRVVSILSRWPVDQSRIS